MTRPVWVDDALFPFESRFVDIGGCTVHYVDEGQGPPILFLHGNPTWSFLYRDIIDLLRHRFRCIALDYPGFGLSSAPTTYRFTPAEHAHIVERFILGHDLGQLTVMGHDWGGPIALGAASRHPERIAALVVANTWAWPANSSPFLQGFSRLAGGPPRKDADRALQLLRQAQHAARNRAHTRSPQGHGALPAPIRQPCGASADLGVPSRNP